MPQRFDENEYTSGDNNISAALIAGSALGEAKSLDGQLVGVVLPPGHTLKAFDTELSESAPTRPRGNIILFDAASFVLSVTDHKNADTRLYANDATRGPGFVAVFNDHTGDGAGWGDFRANYSCPLSDEWKTWTGADKKQMAQADFAQFIEDNLPDIAEPAGAVMLEVSRSLEAKKAVNFASAIRLSNGEQQFNYEETIEGTANKGQLKVPERFAIGIPVFQGAPEKYRIDARLRYRIDGGKLKMWYDLERVHKTLEAAFNEVRTVIETGTGMTAMMGQPATPSDRRSQHV